MDPIPSPVRRSESFRLPCGPPEAPEGQRRQAHQLFSRRLPQPSALAAPDRRSSFAPPSRPVRARRSRIGAIRLRWLRPGLLPSRLARVDITDPRNVRYLLTAPCSGPCDGRAADKTSGVGASRTLRPRSPPRFDQIRGWNATAAAYTGASHSPKPTRPRTSSRSKRRCSLRRSARTHARSLPGRG
jgi:hypothetical protein